MLNMNLDIIIPVYNAKETIKRLLYSIAIQRDAFGFHVYLVNDCSDYDYQEEVSFFKEYFDITEFKLDKNGGPGVARQYGIDHTNSKYITFMDSDDYFYDLYAIVSMYSGAVGRKCDLLVSNFLYERDNVKTVKEKNLIWLHGKVYRREFLENNDIHFNNSSANEDNGFNRFVLLNNPVIAYIDRLTYVYSDYENSITRRNNRLFKFTGLEGYTYNMCWAMDEMIKKNKNIDKVAETSAGVITAMYYYYLELYDQYDVEKILKWTKRTKEIFDTYRDEYINDYQIELFLEGKDREYESANLIKVITFDEFLKKIEEV